MSLAAAATWGAADFNGGMAAKRAPVIPVGAFSQFTGCVVMVLGALALQEPWLGARAIELSILAGAGNALGITALYRSLAEDKMGVGAPVAAVITAVLPVVIGIASQGWPNALQLGGFLLAAIGIWLLAKPQGSAGISRGLRNAVLAGIGFSGFLVLIKYVGGAQAFWPVAIARATSSMLIFLMGLSARARWRDARPAAGFILLAGTLDATGGLLFLVTTHHARLDVAAVLASLYPAATVVLARAVLKERLTRVQTIGMASALAAVVLIAA